MIITCAKCSTQFQLDETRVPESGIRVRCSVCKHAFFVPHPDGFEDDSLDPASGAEALESKRLPGATDDLDGIEGRPTPAGARDDAPEGSWEFNDGGRLSEAANRDASDPFEENFDAARDAVDDLLGGGPWQAPEPPSRSPEPEPEDGLGLGPAEPEDDLGFGPAPAADLVAEPPAGEAPALSTDPWEIEAPTRAGPAAARAGWVVDRPQGPDADRSEDPGNAASDLFEDDDLAGDSPAEPLETGDGDDLDPFDEELSSPESSDEPEIPKRWDLDDGQAAGTVASLHGDGDRLPPAPEEIWGGLPAPSAPSGISAVSRAGAAVAEPVPIGRGARFELERGPSRILAWLAQAGNAIGSGFVAVLAAVALWGTAAPRTLPTGDPGSQALAGLEATGVAGRWVENAVLGPLYVVRGELHNLGPKAKAPGARLVVRLLDAEGAPIEAQAASLSPPVGTVRLREADPRELADAREAAASELSRTKLAPGERVPFEAVVVRMPEAARRFDLAAVPFGAPRP